VEVTTRVLVAYIAGRLLTGRASFAIQDHDRKRRLWMDGTVETAEVKVYSHERHGYVSGLGDGERFSLYQHSGEGHIVLLVNLPELRFEGCEHHSTFHFFGNVADPSVRLYDYQDCQWHRFTLG